MPFFPTYFFVKDLQKQLTFTLTFEPFIDILSRRRGAYKIEDRKCKNT